MAARGRASVATHGVQMRNGAAQRSPMMIAAVVALMAQAEATRKDAG